MCFNLANQKPFNEKMQFLKLYNRKPELTIYAYKYDVRKFIKDTIGEEYLIPLLVVYNSVEAINRDKLPDKRVLKLTHGWGANIICPDKSKFNIGESGKSLENG